MFVTPTLIDPAGNAVHPANSLACSSNSVPPQVAVATDPVFTGSVFLEPLSVKTFHVERNWVTEYFMQQATSQTNPRPTGKELSAALRSLLEKNGVIFTPGKSLIYNERNGVMLLRAGSNDFDIAEQVIQALNVEEPQVMIAGMVMEITEKPGLPSGFDWLARAAGVQLLKSPLDDPLDATNFPGMPAGLLLTNLITDKATAVLTTPQLQAMLKAIGKRKGVQTLLAPRLVTKSGRQARTAANDLMLLPGKTNWTTADQIPVGPSLDMIPFVGTNGTSIELMVRSQKTWAIKKTTIQGQLVATKTSLTDGGTLMLGGLSAVDAAGEKKNLLVFITPRIIDSVGNPVHR